MATSDNPRSEDPLAILAEIEPGLKSTSSRYTIEPDRAAAIGVALCATPRLATWCCWPAKATKRSRFSPDGTIPFDDAQIALSALKEMGYGELTMKLTLAEAAIGAGAVLEAPASVANAGALR